MYIYEKRLNKQGEKKKGGKKEKHKTKQKERGQEKKSWNTLLGWRYADCTSPLTCIKGHVLSYNHLLQIF